MLEEVLLCGALITKNRHAVRRWPEKLQACFLDTPGEPFIFTQKSVSRMYGVCLVSDGSLNKKFDILIRVPKGAINWA
jgi:hypothetical protein